MKTQKTAKKSPQKTVSLNLYDDNEVVYIEIEGEKFPLIRTVDQDIFEDAEITYRVFDSVLQKQLEDIVQGHKDLEAGYHQTLRKDFNIQTIYSGGYQSHYGLVNDEEIDEEAWIYSGSTDIEAVYQLDNETHEGVALINGLDEAEDIKNHAISVLKLRATQLLGANVLPENIDAGEFYDPLNRDFEVGIKGVYVSHLNPAHAAYVEDIEMGHAVFNVERYKILKRLADQFAYQMQDRVVVCDPNDMDRDINDHDRQQSFAEAYRPDTGRVRYDVFRPSY